MTGTYFGVKFFPQPVWKPKLGSMQLGLWRLKSDPHLGLPGATWKTAMKTTGLREKTQRPDTLRLVNQGHGCAGLSLLHLAPSNTPSQ